MTDYQKQIEAQNLELREKVAILEDERERLIGVMEKVQDLIYTIDVGIVDYICNTKKNKNGTYSIDEKSMNTIKGKEMGVGTDLDDMLSILQKETGESFNRNFDS